MAMPALQTGVRRVAAGRSSQNSRRSRCGCSGSSRSASRCGVRVPLAAPCCCCSVLVHMALQRMCATPICWRSVGPLAIAGRSAAALADADARLGALAAARACRRAGAPAAAAARRCCTALALGLVVWRCRCSLQPLERGGRRGDPGTPRSPRRAARAVRAGVQQRGVWRLSRVFRRAESLSTAASRCTATISSPTTSPPSAATRRRSPDCWSATASPGRCCCPRPGAVGGARPLPGWRRIYADRSAVIHVRAVG